MKKTARTHLIRIGNSRGIRIPKLLLGMAGMDEGAELELVADSGGILVRSVRRAREGWEEQIIAAGPDDLALDPPIPTAFDAQEWDW